MKTIRDLRQARAWTQFALALRVGVQPHAIYLWESGRRMPRVLQLRKLGAIFGLCSDDIVLEPRGDADPAPCPPRADGDAGETVAGRDRVEGTATRSAVLYATDPGGP